MKTTTLTIITYDISNNKRRTKLHKLLKGYGQWTQYSVFECFLTDKDWVRLNHELHELCDASEDSVRIYRLCGNCRENVETIGGAKPQEPEVFLV
ncbi:MAG: CRISPR-associated endonuclease Cas2 [Chloroflexi bacterium]|nr:MAG: CRISPR-associated endonuclease Cas2 [Chloroflexota bacterium]